MDRKPKRRTRERILETALYLFNNWGEPNVTTGEIADELNISPGNLYYHFGSKSEIVGELFKQFESEIDKTLGDPGEIALTLEDTWLYLHLIFETIWKYRFLYRDLANILTREKVLKTHFASIVSRQMQTVTAICDNLQSQGALAATPEEIEALARNVVVVMTYWLNFNQLMLKPRADESEHLAYGVYQVLSLVAPYLREAPRRHLIELAKQYIH